MAKTVNKNKNKNIINIKINTEKKVKHKKSHIIKRSLHLEVVIVIIMMR